MLSTRNFTNKIIRRWRIKGWKMIHYKKWFSLDNDMWAEVSGGTLCVSVHMCVCVIMKCRCMSVGIYVKARQEFTLMSHFSGLIHLGILETKTLTVTWGSLIQLGWLVLEPQGSTCLNQPSTWITVVCPLACLFNVCIREQT